MRYFIAAMVIANAWLFYGLDFRFWSVALAAIATLGAMHITGWNPDA